MSTRPGSGFTPRFVVSRTPRGRLRSVSVPVPQADPFPDDLGGPFDFPRRADVIVRQLPDDHWALQDRLSQPLVDVTYEDVVEARARATRLAEERGGVVWLRSDRPRRFERR